MGTPNKVYLIISNKKKIEFSAIKPPVLHTYQVLYKVDEDTPLYKLMDWLADGMRGSTDFERIG